MTNSHTQNTHYHYEKPIKNIPIFRATTLHINRLAFRIFLIFDGLTFTNNNHTHNTQTMHYYKEIHEIAGRDVYAYRVENNNMGSARWVVHFLDLLTQGEIDKAEAETKALKEAHPHQWFSVTDALYEKALAKVREVGGRKYRAKWFGGGFVIQSHNLRLDLEQIFA